MFLHERQTDLKERMDDPHSDRRQLIRTYRHFARLNPLLCGWHRLLKTWIAPLAAKRRPLTLLDIGCGGGDLCLQIAGWADRNRIPVRITGIDSDPRAIEFARSVDRPPSVRFLHASTADLVDSELKYHAVISNHLLHHLSPEELHRICRESELLANDLILFNDIRRSPVGYAAFSAIAPLLFRDSLIVPDGKRSIRRSFRQSELQTLLPDGWTVHRHALFRLLAIRRCKIAPVQPWLNRFKNSSESENRLQNTDYTP